MTLEFPSFFLLNAYFPNSQDGPHRRAYRSAWDAAFFDSVQKLGQKKAVLICRDFEVTFHRALDGASHVKLPKWLGEGKIPDEAMAKIEGFLAYIKGKYGL